MVVCHVLRYTVFYKKLKALVDKGTIGDVVTIMAIENVGYYHQAHSFVRGNWANSDTTSPMILQKCCHDMTCICGLQIKAVNGLALLGESISLMKPTSRKEQPNAVWVAAKQKKIVLLMQKNLPRPL